MKKSLALTSILILCLYANFSFAKEDGGEVGAFLKRGTSVRAIGLGNAYTSICSDSGAVYWNPGGLVQLKEKQVSMIYSQPFSEIPDIGYHGISYAQPLKEDAFGFSIVYSSVAGIPRIDEGDPGIDNPEATFPEFGDTEVALLLSYAADVNPKTSVGATLKYLYQDMENHKSDYGVGLDLGFLYHPHPSVKIGFLVQNLLQPAIRGDSMPTTLRLGSSCAVFKKLILSIDLETVIGRDLEKYLEEHIGVEFEVMRFLRMRGGYSSDSQEFTAGFGFKMEFFGFDYTYSLHPDLGDTHLASITLTFK